MENITMQAVANKILVKQCSASIEMRGSGMVSRGTSHISDVDISKPNTCLSYLFFKLRTRVTWALIMLFLGTVYMLVNVLNFLDLYKEDLHYVLVMGPPPKLHLILLFVATIIGSIFYFPETFNTISVFFRKKGPLLPITVEMLVTISLVHIPISALNYFIAQCRDKYTSVWQILSGVFSIVFVFMRIVWFAHMQGKKLKGNDKKEIRQGMFMAVCALFSCAIAFQILTWRDAPFSVSLKDKHTEGVSIILVRIPEKTNRRLNNYKIDSHFYNQSINPRLPYMVKELSDVVDKGTKGVTVYYDCTELKPSQTRPEECSRNQTSGLLFTFMFQPRDDLPYGEVLYNFAMVGETNVSNLNIYSEITVNLSHTSEKDTDDTMQPEVTQINNNTDYSNNTNINSTSSTAATVRKSEPYVLTKEKVFSPVNTDADDLNYTTCSEASSRLADDWLLWYVIVKQGPGREVNITSPWTSCTTVHPRYSSSVLVCSRHHPVSDLPKQ